MTTGTKKKPSKQNNLKVYWFVKEDLFGAGATDLPLIVIRLQYQGDEIKDTDIPTYLEAKLFCTTFGKFIWVMLQPFFYAFRPLVTYPKKPTTLEFVNTVIQLIFDAIVVYFFGKRRSKNIFQTKSKM